MLALNSGEKSKPPSALTDRGMSKSDDSTYQSNGNEGRNQDIVISFALVVRLPGSWRRRDTGRVIVVTPEVQR